MLSVKYYAYILHSLQLKISSIYCTSKILLNAKNIQIKKFERIN